MPNSQTKRSLWMVSNMHLHTLCLSTYSSGKANGKKPILWYILIFANTLHLKWCICQIRTLINVNPISWKFCLKTMRKSTRSSNQMIDTPWRKWFYIHTALQSIGYFLPLVFITTVMTVGIKIAICFYHHCNDLCWYKNIRCMGLISPTIVTMGESKRYLALNLKQRLKVSPC